MAMLDYSGLKVAVQQHGTATITVKDLEEYYEQSGVSG